MPLLHDPLRVRQASRVWGRQRQPSARTVAMALTQAGTPVHFTTIARWKRSGWLPSERPDRPAGARREAQLFTPTAPVTPLEAKGVWESQARPSCRSVARALTATGRPVHFTTVARWKKHDWCAGPRPEHPLNTALRMVDAAVPLLTGDPTTLAKEILVGTQIEAVSGVAEDHDRLKSVARDSLKISIVALRQIRGRCDELLRNKSG